MESPAHLENSLLNGLSLNYISNQDAYLFTEMQAVTQGLPRFMQFPAKTCQQIRILHTIRFRSAVAGSWGKRSGCSRERQLGTREGQRYKLQPRRQLQPRRPPGNDCHGHRPLVPGRLNSMLLMQVPVSKWNGGALRVSLTST